MVAEVEEAILAKLFGNVWFVESLEARTGTEGREGLEVSEPLLRLELLAAGAPKEKMMNAEIGVETN